MFGRKTPSRPSWAPPGKTSEMPGCRGEAPPAFPGTFTSCRLGQFASGFQCDTFLHFQGGLFWARLQLSQGQGARGGGRWRWGWLMRVADRFMVINQDESPRPALFVLLRPNSAPRAVQWDQNTTGLTSPYASGLLCGLSAP